MIEIPDYIVPKAISENLITSNAISTSEVNQSMQINASPFHKWSISYQYPPLTKNAEREMRRILSQVGQLVRAPMIDVNSDIPIGAGSITVASGSSGKLLNITGINAALVLKQWVSIIISGKSYLYLLAADSVAGSTSRTLNLTSSLRVMPSVGDVVNVAPAYVEGYLSADSRQMNASVDNGGYYAPSFTITEVK